MICFLQKKPKERKKEPSNKYKPVSLYLFIYSLASIHSYLFTPLKEFYNIICTK